MNGVEDIPGAALHEGMPWGAWQTYAEYLDFLSTRGYAINISCLVAHGAVRKYVMGERGRTNEAATEDDLARMGDIVEEALRAGAVGFSTSRILGHRSIQGEPVPATFTLFQVDDWSDKWRDAIDRVKAGNAQGAQVFPHVGSRPTGLVLSMQTYHNWLLKPSYQKLKSLPVTERLQAMQQPEVKRASMREKNDVEGVPMVLWSLALPARN